MRLYYFHDGSIERGPYQIHELPIEQLNRQTPCWYEGLAQWTNAENISEINSQLKTPPPFNADAKIPVPPPFADSNSGYIDRSSRRTKLPLIIGALVVIGIIAFLFISNQQQGETIDSLQTQQIIAETEKDSKEEERKRINKELTERNMRYRNSWPEFISASPNRYRYNELGGIYDLEVKVKNRTEGLLDEVVVTVNYIKANGNIWRTVDVPVTNIAANSTKSISLPDVERSTSVDMMVKSIVSKKLHFYYAEDYSSGNPEDPYFNK